MNFYHITIRMHSHNITLRVLYITISKIMNFNISLFIVLSLELIRGIKTLSDFIVLYHSHMVVTGPSAV